MNTMPLEADTRLLIDNTLVNLGWVMTGKGKNVYCERPRTAVERKRLGGKRPDYVLYSKQSDVPLIVIEAKKKGERIDAALEQGVSYAKELGAPLVFATDGVFCKSYHTLGKTTPKLNGEDVDEFVREATALRFLTSWEVNTISPKVQYDRKELIKIFDEANNMLRGDGLRAGIERFGEFANILFLKLVSENEQNKRDAGLASSFDPSCSWDTIKGITPTARIDYINTMVYRKLNRLYQTEIFTPLTIRDNAILKEMMDKLDPLTLTDVNSDVKGDAFEYFLKASTASKNDLGEYFTPRHIVKTMVRLVNPQLGEKIYDPFCGTGGFLIEAFRYIYNNMPRNPSTEKTLREETIYGNEITNTARITKMNMILAGDGHSNIHMKDSLADPVEGKYDVVLANMPYSQKTKCGGLYDIPSANGDSVCVQHCMKAINGLSENGRMALVVPEGFLFRKDLAKTREYLLMHAQLQSVISLPQGVFLPYTGVKTNIIYATKVNQKVPAKNKRKDFWYFDVKSDGYTLDNHRRKLQTSSDLTRYEEYRRLDSDQASEMLQAGFEIIPLDKVQKNSFILVGSRYRTSAVQPTEFPFICLGDEKYFTIYSGGTPSSANPNYWGGGINWITLADLPAENLVTKISKTERAISAEGLENSNAKLLPVNSVVVSSRATIGRVGIVKTELATNQGFKNIVIRDPSLVLPEYLAFVLIGKRDEMLSLASGATFKEISKESFGTIQVPLPPLAKQQQIVNELEGYRQMIDSARSIVEKYSPTIPQRIKGELRALETIATIRPPKGEVKELSRDTLVSFVPMADVNTHSVSFAPKEVRPISEVLGGFTYFREDDVLLAKIAPCFENGKSGIARNLKNGIGFGSTEFIVIRANTAITYPEWIYYHISSKEFLLQGKSFMTGTAGQQRIDLDYVKQYQIPVPPLEVQRAILEEIQTEQTLVESSKQLIEVFTQKLQKRINEIGMHPEET